LAKVELIGCVLVEVLLELLLVCLAMMAERCLRMLAVGNLFSLCSSVKVRDDRGKRNVFYWMKVEDEEFKNPTYFSAILNS